VSRRVCRGATRRAGPRAAALAAMVLAALAPVHGRAAEAPGATAPAPAAARTYADPKGRFILAVPPDAKVEGGSGNIDVAIESRKGYIINLQSGKVNPKASIEGLVGRLEKHYLGAGRPWSRKLAGGPRTVAGLPGYETVYDGGRTRVRVVIARGRVHDFVFMFFATPKVFDRLTKELEWVLAGFRPAAAEMPPAAATAPAPAPPAAAKRPAPPAPPPAGPEAGVRHFTAVELGFSIDYPGDWVAARPSPFTVIFSGREGTNAYFATVSIRNVKTAEGDGTAAVGAVIADLKAQIDAGASAVSYFGEGPLAYEHGGLSLEGRQFLATYTRAGQRFRKWSVAVPHPGGGVVHVWSYTAPATLFDIYRPMAEAMRKTWAIAPGKR